jgi:hypothetical protein
MICRYEEAGDLNVIARRTKVTARKTQLATNNKVLVERFQLNWEAIQLRITAETKVKLIPCSTL